MKFINFVKQEIAVIKDRDPLPLNQRWRFFFIQVLKLY